SGEFSLKRAVANQRGNAERGEPEDCDQEGEPFQPARPGTAWRRSRIDRLRDLNCVCVRARHGIRIKIPRWGRRASGWGAARPWSMACACVRGTGLDTEDAENGHREHGEN